MRATTQQLSLTCPSTLSLGKLPPWGHSKLAEQQVDVLVPSTMDHVTSTHPSTHILCPHQKPHLLGGGTGQDCVSYTSQWTATSFP